MLFKQNLRFILTSSAPLHFRFSDFKCGYDVCGHIMRSYPTGRRRERSRRGARPRPRAGAGRAAAAGSARPAR